MCIFIPSNVDTNSGKHNAVFSKNMHDINCLIICYCTLDSFFTKISSTLPMSYFNATTTLLFCSIYSTIPITEYSSCVLK